MITITDIPLLTHDEKDTIIYDLLCAIHMAAPHEMRWNSDKVDWLCLHLPRTRLAAREAKLARAAELEAEAAKLREEAQ